MTALFRNITTYCNLRRNKNKAYHDAVMAASTTCARTLLIALAGVLVLATVFVSVQDEVFAGHRTVSGVQQHQQLQQHRLRSIGELPYPASPASLVPTSRHSRTATQPPTAVAGIDQIPTLTKPAATTAAAAAASLSQPQPAELPKAPLTVIDYSDEPKVQTKCTEATSRGHCRVRLTYTMTDATYRKHLVSTGSAGMPSMGSSSRARWQRQSSKSRRLL